MPSSPERRLTDDQMNELAEFLRGTPQSLESALSACFDDMALDNLTIADHQELDQRVFECGTCNWWCELSEMSETEDGVCDECCEDNEEAA